MANILITMAGRGSRFYTAGYTVPKYAIETHGRTLFEWSMLSLKNMIAPDDQLIFVCLAENDSGGFVKAACEKLGYFNVVIHELTEVSDGQATSAWLSRDCWRMHEPLLIYNIDTYVQPEYLTPDRIRAGSNGWIPCFQMPGEHWSFVRTGHDGWAVEVSEKRRISAYASIGLYWFSTAQSFSEAYTAFFADSGSLVNGEKYIAPMYEYYIRNNMKVSISDIPPDAVHVLGTPKELDAFSSALTPAAH